MGRGCDPFDCSEGLEQWQLGEVHGKHGHVTNDMWFCHEGKIHERFLRRSVNNCPYLLKILLHCLNFKVLHTPVSERFCLSTQKMWRLLAANHNRFILGKQQCWSKALIIGEHGTASARGKACGGWQNEPGVASVSKLVWKPSAFRDVRIFRA